MYAWKNGTRFKTDPNVAGSVFEVMTQQGRLTAENLVEDSRPANAPLHNEFEWNDTIAAEEWRKHTARRIIGGLEIKILECDPVQAFVKLNTQESNYHQTEMIIRRKEIMEQLLENALKELENFKRKYGHLEALAEVISACDSVLGGQNGN